MRFLVLCVGGILAAVASAKKSCDPAPQTPGRCRAGKCFRAINDIPSIGKPFCSSYLSLEPALASTITTTTTAIVKTETVISTRTNIDASTTTVFETASTITSTLSSTVTVMDKRTVSVQSQGDPATSILSVCRRVSSRISSACSCLLASSSSSSSPPPHIATETVYETATSIAVSEIASTSVETLTSTVTLTTFVTPTVTVEAFMYPIVNGGFEGSPLPWKDSTMEKPGQTSYIPGFPVCFNTDLEVVCHVSDIMQFKPTDIHSIDLSQTFTAQPETMYTLSFVFRCIEYDWQSGVEVVYNGLSIGRFYCSSHAWFEHADGVEFVTDATGEGELELRFLNLEANPRLYYYLDDVLATRVLV